MSTPFQQELQHYLKIQQELARDNDGKYVAIKGEEVLGIYDDYKQAANAVYIAHEYGTVMMKKISSDPNSHIIISNSPRISYAT